MNILILEGNPHYATIIESILRQQLNNIENIFQSKWIEEGLSIIKRKKPDLIITDMVLEDACGIEILDKLSSTTTYIMCLSNNSRFAIEAVKYDFVKDYLIMPLNIDEIRGSISRFKGSLSNNFIKKPSASENIEYRGLTYKLSYTSNHTIEYIDLKNVIRVEAMRSYCKVILNNKRSLIYSKSLSSLEKQLPQGTFFRVHKSHLINMKHVESLKKNGAMSIKMNDESMIPLARERKKEFIAMLGTY
jgi:two-component system LytT family response regulator